MAIFENIFNRIAELSETPPAADVQMLPTLKPTRIPLKNRPENRNRFDDFVNEDEDTNFKMIPEIPNHKRKKSNSQRRNTSAKKIPPSSEKHLGAQAPNQLPNTTHYLT